MQPADRLQTVSEYYFSRKLREIKELEQQSREVINLGIGSPDLSPPASVIETLNEAFTEHDAHRYQSYQGIPELRSAISVFMSRHYGFTLDPFSEILPLIGSKEGITHISLAFLNKGDKVLVPELGYPTYTAVTHMVEAIPVYYPLQDSGEPDWSFFENFDFSGVKLMWANYPHMPTGFKGSREVLGRLVEIANKNDLLLVHDNPYSFILNEHPTSIFQVEEAKKVGLELNSLSKSFNMSGWRVGWVCGGAEHLKQITRIKSNVDSGMFKPVQLAAVTALGTDKKWFETLNEEYLARKVIVHQILKALNCDFEMDQAGLFVWARCPADGEELVDQLLHEKFIFITPGHIFGEKGRRHVRLSLCSPIDRLEKALNRLERA